MFLKNLKNKYLPESINETQCKDSGMALVLICLITGYYFQKNTLVFFAILFLIVNMAKPGVYRPFAKLWLGLSHLLGTLVSKIILTFIFFLLVTPVGVLRRIAGKDSLCLKVWKKDATSAFRVRDHLFEAEEIEKPY